MKFLALMRGIGQMIIGIVLALIVLFLAVTMFMEGSRILGGLLFLFLGVIVYYLNQLRKNPYRVKYAGEPWS